MKFTCSIEIDQPIAKVIVLFDNPDNLFSWMRGLESFEHLSGVRGQPGAKSRLKFNMGNRQIEMIETILVRNLPDEFTGSYEAKGVYNIVRNKFVSLSQYKTKYISEQEFRFTGFMNVIGWLMPGAFKKQSMQYLRDFKEFAEMQ